ncbi:MAG: hypothetical protein ABIJ21_05630 [Nanoarchaeota archaeon]
MFISIPQYVPSFSIVLILILLILLITYELLSEERKGRVRFLLAGSIIALLACAVLIFVHRLEGIV